MSSCPDFPRMKTTHQRRAAPRLAGLAAATLLLAALSAQALAQGAYPGVGRSATPKEVAAWDIDVRPDFKGLPAGSGSVAKGLEVWEAKCASCHGIFGESNEVFSPLVGGTTAADVQTGRVARLNDPSFPGRTTLMKVATVSTLWDYINRAMPWTAPKTLTVEEVYAVTAYLLNLGGVLPDDFVMSDKNIAEVQARLPNRKGMSTDHHLWPGKTMGQAGRPDVKATACLKNCAPEPKLASFLPDFARNAHGNLAEQNRLFGAQRGANTDQPPPASIAAAASTLAAVKAPGPASASAEATTRARASLAKNNCTACHGMDSKIVGPGFSEIARKYSARADAVAYLAGKIKAGGQGVWGAIPMPAQALPEAEARMLAEWLAQGAAK